jgi:hypothetical protein
MWRYEKADCILKDNAGAAPHGSFTYLDFEITSDVMNRLWVVEIQFDERSDIGWESTTIAKLTRHEALVAAVHWQNRNYKVRTRVRAYHPVRRKQWQRDLTKSYKAKRKIR